MSSGGSGGGAEKAGSTQEEPNRNHAETAGIERRETHTEPVKRWWQVKK